MEVMGICSICGRPGKMFSCMLCGRPVCSQCLAGNGTCVKCSHGRFYSASRTLK